MKSVRIRSARKYFAVAIALFGCLFIVAIAHAIGPNDASAPSPTATPGAGVSAPHFPPSPSAAPPILASASGPALPTERQAVLDRRATEIAAPPKVAPAIKGPPAEPMKPTSTPATGILNVQISPFSAHDAIITNRWQGTVGGGFVVVYAGRLTQTPDQGLVAVSLGEPGRPNFSLQQYPTPTKSGSVHIISANGSLLTLVSDKGQVFVFDVGARLFK